MGDSPSKPDDTTFGQGGLDVLAYWSRAVQGEKPAGKLIIFDWDDTLLCSSAINLQQCTPAQLQQLEYNVEQVLNAAIDLGETMIVTNGKGSWVQDSARRFLPKLVPLLNRLEVMSARAAYERSYPGDPYAWKMAAFKQVLCERQEKSTYSGGLDLIVLGDSMAEIQAAQTATQSLQRNSVVKTVKFKEMPSVDELLGQLRVVTQMLPELMTQDSSQAKVLVLRSLPPHLGYLTAWASGWRVTDHRPTGAFVDTRSQSSLTMAIPVAPLLESHSPVTLAGG